MFWKHYCDHKPSPWFIYQLCFHPTGCQPASVKYHVDRRLVVSSLEQAPLCVYSRRGLGLLRYKSLKQWPVGVKTQGLADSPAPMDAYFEATLLR